jgi:DNA-binding SARP family transcriptional activator/predicted Zn-dependent protease
MDIRIDTLGGLRVRVDDRESSSLREQPVRAALLLLLAMEREITRDRITGILWPDQAPDRARHTLSQTLYRLRQDLGDDWVVSEGEHLRIGPRVRVDALEFLAASGEDGPQDLESALALYRGPFLHGWGLSVATEFEHWVDHQRLTLSRAHREVCRARIAQLKKAGAGASALETARHWTEVDPLEDEAHHLVIELLAESGRRSEALERYEAFRGLLAADELRPLDETEELVRRIREDLGGGSLLKPVAPPVAGPLSVPAAHAPSTPRPRIRFRRIALVAALVLLTSVGGRWVYQRLALPSPTSSDVVPYRVLVVPLDNRTDRPDLGFVGGLAADWITRGLSDLEYLEVRPASEFMGVEGATGATPPPLDLASRMRAGILVSGTYYTWGPGLEFHVQILGLPGGEVLEAIGPVRSEALDPMETVDIIRQRVAVALALQLDEELTPLSASTLPPTLEAYQAYSSGARKYVVGDRAEAVADLEEAYHRSPEFTAPLIYAAFGRFGLGDPHGADSLAQILEADKANLPPYDRFRLELLQARLRGNNAEAYRAVKRAWEVMEGGSAHYMSAQMALELNRPREALQILETFDATREWSRAWAPYWNVVTGALHLLGEHERELEVAREGYRLNPDRMPMLAWEVRALAALGRWNEIQPLLARAGSIRGPDRTNPGSVMLVAAQVMWRHGFDAEALACLDRALDWAASLGPDDPRSERLRVSNAETLYLKGALLQKRGSEEAAATLRAAQREFEALAQGAPDNPLFLGRLGAISARLGQPARAREISGSLGDLDRPYLLGQHTYCRARIAALLGEREEAVRLLWQAVGEGISFGVGVHADPDLEPLRDFPPFLEFIRPKG